MNTLATSLKDGHRVIIDIYSNPLVVCYNENNPDES